MVSSYGDVAESGRGNRRRLVTIFVVATVAAAVAEIVAVVAIRPAQPLEARLVAEGVVVVLLIGVAAVFVGVLSIFGRLVPETVPLNVIPSQRRQAVSKAVRSNDWAAIREGEDFAALNYAAAYERNTPLVLLRTSLLSILLILMVLLFVLVGAVNSQLVYYVYFLVVFAIVLGTFVARRRTVRQVRHFISGDPTFTQASAEG